MGWDVQGHLWLLGGECFVPVGIVLRPVWLKGCFFCLGISGGFVSKHGASKPMPKVPVTGFLVVSHSQVEPPRAGLFLAGRGASAGEVAQDPGLGERGDGKGRWKAALPMKRDSTTLPSLASTFLLLKNSFLSPFFLTVWLDRVGGTRESSWNARSPSAGASFLLYPSVFQLAGGLRCRPPVLASVALAGGQSSCGPWPIPPGSHCLES